ncbi:hypothetical protein BaRGS_00033726 [Batillaria attramentaria]|uniref:Leucine-rich repeat-containing protein 43 n=1 Tax=Batillaria attramentaria TaxID=370345 RepID=A0ABD0JK49_9CAEN
MAADVQTDVRAFSAFESQLKTLCLREFPCGAGTWREVDTKYVIQKKKPQYNIYGRVPQPPPPVLNLTRDAQTERADALEELVGSKSSPWHLDYSWSDEAKELREIAVKSPWLIDNQFVLNHFRTLKIVDKGVTDVDKGLLKLQNLSELTLTANFIHTVNSKHLPQSLQVLELCANEISDISPLCIRPPFLLHLGLGYNRICFIDDYITGDYWPALLSLDLSNNNLTDLLDIIRKVSTLPKLRNLILLGNPLSLIPGYRGYTIDSLRRLSVLDDIRISADERHHFKGLARRREYILDEAKVSLEVSYLKGVPTPEEIKNPDDQPEFPIVERLYFIKFMFPAEQTAHSNRLNMTQEDLEELGTIPDAEHHDLASDLQSARFGGSQQSSVSHPEKNVIFNNQLETKMVENLPLPLIQETEEPRPASVAGSQKSEGEGVKATGSGQEPPATKPAIPLAAITSVSKPWAEEIEMEWKVDVVRDNLTTLRDFFKQGMDFSVVEEMVLCYPVEEEGEGTDTPTGSKKSKDNSKDKKDAKGKVSQSRSGSSSRSVSDLETPALGILLPLELSLWSGVWCRENRQQFCPP